MKKIDLTHGLSREEARNSRILEPGVLSFKDSAGFWCLRYMSKVVNVLDYRQYLDDAIDTPRYSDMPNVIIPRLISNDEGITGIIYTSIDLIKYNPKSQILVFNLTTECLDNLVNHRRCRSIESREGIKVMKLINLYTPIKFQFSATIWNYSGVVVKFPGVVQELRTNKPMKLQIPFEIFYEELKRTQLLEMKKHRVYNKWMKDVIA